MVLMSFEVGEIKNRDVNETSKMFEILWWFSHFLSTKSSKAELGWTGFNLRGKNLPLFMFYLHVSQRLFQQVFAKWERNARNPESKSRQIVLFWLELSTSLSTLPITLLRHTPPSAAHVVEKTFAKARRIEKKRKQKIKISLFSSSGGMMTKWLLSRALSLPSPEDSSSSSVGGWSKPYSSPVQIVWNKFSAVQKLFPYLK